MKYLILLLFLPLFLHAETTNETDFMMTKAEFEECYKNKEKTEQRFLIRQNGKTGFIDGCGRVVIEPIYDSALEFSEGLARVEKDKKYGYIDKSGKVVIDFYLDFAWFFYEGLAPVKLGSYLTKRTEFYIDKQNKRHPARNLEKSTDKIITFRKHYDNFVLTKWKTNGNAFVLGKGLVGEIEYYTDYSGQNFGYYGVVNNEPVESCDNLKLLRNNGNLVFVKNGKILNLVEESDIYEIPVCRNDTNNIVWVEKRVVTSDSYKSIRSSKDFSGIKKPSFDTLLLFNSDGLEIAGFESAEIIKRVDYLDKNTLKISFNNGRNTEIFDLTGKKQHSIDSGERSWLPKEIGFSEKSDKKSSLNEKTVKSVCPDFKFVHRDKIENKKKIYEYYDLETGKLLFSGDFFPKKFQSLNQGCLVVIKTSDKIYYLNKDYKAFWSREIEEEKKDKRERQTRDSVN